MVHVLATLSFTAIAAASAVLIWSMLSVNREAILTALRIAPSTPLRRVERRRAYVRSVQPVTMRMVLARRAA